MKSQHVKEGNLASVFILGGLSVVVDRVAALGYLYYIYAAVGSCSSVRNKSQTVETVERGVRQ